MSSYEKIDVQICVGTTCYVLGASDLLTLESYLTPDLREKITLRGSPCLGLCRSGGPRPPFVLIDGGEHGEVTVRRLLRLIEERVQEKGGFHAGDGK